MKKVRNSLAFTRPQLLLVLAALLFVAWLMLYRLGSLVGGLSAAEHLSAIRPVGWHGIYHRPLYLPLEVARSVDFAIFVEHGRTLTRLPNTLFGALALFLFTWLVWVWHGRRTALFAGVLFATGAWTLHVSRLASYDVLYLAALPALLLGGAELQRLRGAKAWVFYGNMLLWGCLLYIPGLVWLVLANVILLRKSIAAGWRHFGSWWQRLLYVLAGLIWLPLLVIDLERTGQLRAWLGAPAHFAPLHTLLKQFAAVFVHLFIRGPEYPQLWLARAPLLDIFTLVCCLIGIYFYARHWQAARSRMLLLFFLIGAVLVALGGSVGLSLLVPLMYLLAATGIAFLLREWLRVFPRNPLARRVGIGLIAAAVALACLYNLRAYFVAWPHNDVTKTIFRYQPKR